jgi:hypothetical protein
MKRVQWMICEGVQRSHKSDLLNSISVIVHRQQPLAVSESSQGLA